MATHWRTTPSSPITAEPDAHCLEPLIDLPLCTAMRRVALSTDSTCPLSRTTLPTLPRGSSFDPTERMSGRRVQRTAAAASLPMGAKVFRAALNVTRGGRAHSSAILLPPAALSIPRSTHAHAFLSSSWRAASAPQCADALIAYALPWRTAHRNRPERACLTLMGIAARHVRRELHATMTGTAPRGTAPPRRSPTLRPLSTTPHSVLPDQSFHSFSAPS